MNLSIKIPVQYYLKKYLSKKVEVTPFQLSNKGCHISALILEPLAKDFYPKREPLDPKYNDFIEFEMNSSIVNEKRFQIDAKIVYRINKLLRDKFNDEFFHWVNQIRESTKKTGEEIEINGAIHQFMEYYDLHEDDIQFETLKKIYWRERNPPRPIEKTPKPKLQLELPFFQIQ